MKKALSDTVNTSHCETCRILMRANHDLYENKLTKGESTAVILKSACRAVHSRSVISDDRQDCQNMMGRCSNAKGKKRRIVNEIINVNSPQWY